MDGESLINKDLSAWAKKIKKDITEEQSVIYQRVEDSISSYLQNIRSSYKLSFSSLKLLILETVLLVLLVGFFIFNNYNRNGLKYISYENQVKFRLTSFSKKENINICRYEFKPVTLKDPIVSSQAYYVYSPDTNHVFLRYNENKRLPIASLTKLMTALIVVDQYDLDSYITVDEDFSELEWRLGLERGDKIKVIDALKAALISSYNDAGMVLALSYQDGGKKGFIQEMNRYAESYAMFDTHFSNPIGLDDKDNFSTANDLHKLVSFILQNKQILQIVKSPEATIDIVRNNKHVHKRIYSTNYFIGRDPTVLGLKTGYTTDAGQCLITYMKDSSDRKFIFIVLGSEQRFDDTNVLRGLLRGHYY